MMVVRKLVEQSSHPTTRIEDATPRHVVDLQADAVGVFKEYGVVARCPGILLRGIYNLAADLGQERVDLIDVFARAHPEADVMQADPKLLEPCASMFG